MKGVVFSPTRQQQQPAWSAIKAVHNCLSDNLFFWAERLGILARAQKAFRGTLSSIYSDFQRRPVRTKRQRLKFVRGIRQFDLSCKKAETGLGKWKFNVISWRYVKCSTSWAETKVILQLSLSFNLQQIYGVRVKQKSTNSTNLYTSVQVH